MAGIETYGPFDSQPWADQTQWYRFGPTWAPSGVIDSPAASPSAGSLGITFSALTPTLSAGRAWARGAGYELSGGAKTMVAIAANTNASLYRRDRIVLRRDLSAKTVSLVPLTGTPASTPVAPALTQVEAGQWDTPLFSFLVPPSSGTIITGIVDERDWVNPGGLPRLGIVIAAEQASAQSVSSATAARVVGSTNITPVLSSARAYRVKWSSMAQTDTVGAVLAVSIHGHSGTSTVSTADTLAAQGAVPFNATGGPGALVLDFSDLFTVATSGQYTLSAFISRPAGNGTVSISGAPHIEIEDVGVASALSGFAQLS